MFHVRVAPSAATIGRVLNAVCPGGLAYLFGAETVGAGQTVTQLWVSDKTNVV